MARQIYPGLSRSELSGLYEAVRSLRRMETGIAGESQGCRESSPRIPSERCMSRPRDLALYPSRYLEIASLFQSGTRRMILVQKNEKAAIKLRLDLYGFRKTLERSGQRSDYSQFFAVRMFVRGRKLTLIHADETFK
jgi:hypothetical protein